MFGNKTFNFKRIPKTMKTSALEKPEMKREKIKYMERRKSGKAQTLLPFYSNILR